MLMYLRNIRLPFFLTLVAQFCLVLQHPTCSQPGCQGGGASWVGRRRRGKEQGLCICQSEVSLEGRTHGKMGFIVNCHLFLDLFFSLVVYISHLKLQRRYEACGQFLLLPPILTDTHLLSSLSFQSSHFCWEMRLSSRQRWQMVRALE